MIYSIFVHKHSDQLMQALLQDIKWTFRRRMMDYRHHTKRLARGEATIHHNSYEENGKWTLPYTHPIPFYQSYTLNFIHDNILNIHLVNGNLLAQLDLNQLDFKFRHLCGDDIYTGRLKGQGIEKFLIHWHVQGPRKFYTIETIYRAINRIAF